MVSSETDLGGRNTWPVQTKTSDGSRLKLREAGARDALGIGLAWDHKLAFRCSFATASDGQLRCLPQGDLAQHRGWEAQKYFSDQGCAESLVEVCGLMAGDVRIALWPMESGGFAGPLRPPDRLRQMQYGVLGQVLKPTDLYKKFHLGCERQGPPRDACKARAIEQGLTLTTFVAAAGPPKIAGQEGSRLRPRIVLGEDGSRIPYDYWDAELEMSCRFDLHPSAPDRCLPHLPDFTFVSTYLDKNCQEKGVLACSWTAASTRIGPLGRWHGANFFHDPASESRAHEPAPQFVILGEDKGVCYRVPQYINFPDARSCNPVPAGNLAYEQCHVYTVARKMPLDRFAKR